MIDPMTLANNVLSSNPGLANDPNNKSIIDIIRRNDSQAGIAMANQILQKVGVTKEQALQMAQQRFNVR